MPSTGGTVTTPAPDTTTHASGNMDPASFDELMDGLPEAQKTIKTNRIADNENSANVPPGVQDVPSGMVMLLNLRYDNEKIYLPESDGDGRKFFTGENALEFVDGRLITTPERAEFIKSLCPYVYIEPNEGPWLEFTADGFRTRVPEAFSEYAARWAANQ
jgi:hypothetical protein